MRKIGILVCLLVMLSGCAPVSGSLPAYDSSKSEAILPTSQKPPVNVTWVSPGKVMVGNFHSGAQAEYPITIHNGKTYQSDEIRVTTDVGEVEGDVPLTSELTGDDVHNVMSIISDNPQDRLEVVGYKQGSLVVGGFAPNGTRTLSLTYKCDTEYSITYEPPDWADSQYRDVIKPVEGWVMIADSTPVLEPLETRDITVTLAMPAEAVAPLQSFEFWILVTQKQSGASQTAMASRWLVTMRQ